MLRHPPTPTLFPYTTLFRSHHRRRCPIRLRSRDGQSRVSATVGAVDLAGRRFHGRRQSERPRRPRDRKSTRLNSSHVAISYAVFCLKKKKTPKTTRDTKRQN